jgi:hypothetical protein
MNNINNEIKEQYTISLDDIDIPEELKINIPQFFQNVNIFLYNDYYILFSLVQYNYFERFFKFTRY